MHPEITNTRTHRHDIPQSAAFRSVISSRAHHHRHVTRGNHISSPFRHAGHGHPRETTTTPFLVA
ncbi:hypothetical protein TIFTF001_028768 [Ficus carica]|uniref:Uncharacterized protein n=1 Tax=Ficus carica TaxID=3494 RepID=A0AA88DQK2_FICCA|nr:hypothetical protein TIFTF001_028768 [Ficus carica]